MRDSTEETPGFWRWIWKFCCSWAFRRLEHDDLIAYLRRARADGVLDSDALGMMLGVLAVSNRQVRDIMTPGAQTVTLHIEDKLADCLPVVVSSGHSRFPVVNEERNQIHGLLLSKDLLQFTLRNQGSFDLNRLCRPALFVPESKRLNVLLREFRESRNHMAIVLDEYGNLAGIVTIEDVIEEIVGEIEDEYDVNLPDGGLIKWRQDHEYHMNALTPIALFNDFFKVQLPSHEFDTVAGLVLQAFGRLPNKGESIQLHGFLFTVLGVDSRRIRSLAVQIPPDLITQHTAP